MYVCSIAIAIGSEKLSLIFSICSAVMLLSGESVIRYLSPFLSAVIPSVWYKDLAIQTFHTHLANDKALEKLNHIYQITHALQLITASIARSFTVAILNPNGDRHNYGNVNEFVKAPCTLVGHVISKSPVLDARCFESSKGLRPYGLGMQHVFAEAYPSARWTLLDLLHLREPEGLNEQASLQVTCPILHASPSIIL